MVDERQDPSRAELLAAGELQPALRGLAAALTGVASLSRPAR
jgi:hypothetical protein